LSRLNSRLKKIELLRQIQTKDNESKIVFISYIGVDDKEDYQEKNVIGIKINHTFHKREDDESFDMFQERISTTYQGKGRIFTGIFEYRDKQ